ncbi:MAG: efflux RND transporter periplasmic adaptor subunit [Clostridia bacterium]|nr:efflux RND transporter periplasmic adaptor subunit [Clostridia bacterium]
MEEKEIEKKEIEKKKIEGKKFSDLKVLVSRKKTMIAAIVLIVVILFAFKVFAAEKTEESVQDNIVTVEVEEAKMTDSMAGLSYKADLEAAEDAIVSSNVSGKITQVLFEDGDKVTQGQALAYLDDKDLQNQLKTAKIDLNKLQLELASEQSNYNTAKELYANGALSKNDYEDAELKYKTVLANVELKRVNIQDISNSLNDCVIKAPITGEVGGKSISLGQYVSPGTVFATVKNNTSIKAVIQLMQEDLEKVTVGQTVTLMLSQEGSKSYEGIVETIAASANSDTRVFDCLIIIDNANGMLNSGVSAYIEIPDPENKQALAVPMSAISGSEGDYSVFMIKDNTAQKISVTIGEIADDMVEIKTGLQEGDQIIVSNLNSLQDGDKVTVSGEGK